MTNLLQTLREITEMESQGKEGSPSAFNANPAFILDLIKMLQADRLSNRSLLFSTIAFSITISVSLIMSPTTSTLVSIQHKLALFLFFLTGCSWAVGSVYMLFGCFRLLRHPDHRYSLEYRIVSAESASALADGIQKDIKASLLSLYDHEYTWSLAVVKSQRLFKVSLVSFFITILLWLTVIVCMSFATPATT